jgi:hypothetical protein
MAAAVTPNQPALRVFVNQIVTCRCGSGPSFRMNADWCLDHWIPAPWILSHCICSVKRILLCALSNDANLHSLLERGGSRDSSVGIALGYGLDDRGSRVRFPAGVGNFSLHHRVHNVSGVHPASYPMGTRGSFPGGKAAGAWSWPLTSI